MDDGALLCLSVASRVAVACGLWARPRGVCGDRAMGQRGGRLRGGLRGAPVHRVGVALNARHPLNFQRSSQSSLRRHRSLPEHW